MLNCHSPIVSDELSWLCSWLLSTILFMSLTYAALAVITAFCKPSPTLALRTNYRPAKGTELLTDFQRTGRNTTEGKGVKRNCSTFETCMIKSMTTRHESSTQCLLGSVQSVQFSVIWDTTKPLVKGMHRGRALIHSTWGIYTRNFTSWLAQASHSSEHLELFSILGTEVKESSPYVSALIVKRHSKMCKEAMKCSW